MQNDFIKHILKRNFNKLLENIMKLTSISSFFIICVYKVRRCHNYQILFFTI